MDVRDDQDTAFGGGLIWRPGEEVKPIRLLFHKPLLGRRLDRYLAGRFAQYSRAFFQRKIKAGDVLVNGRPAKASQELRVDDVITFLLPKPPRLELIAEDIPLRILFEDEFMLAVNKPPGIIVHPAKGHRRGTLVNALLHHCQELAPKDANVRPGLVHRLDRDTSGVLLVAKSEQAHATLAIQFENRTVHKQYHALVEGVLEFDSDIISKPIGRHPKDRTRMSVRVEVGRAAESFYEVIERFRRHSYVRVLPRTGRTHQIRVHLRSLGHPVVADREYAYKHELYRSDLLGRAPAEGEEPLINRQALHAACITFRHPVTAQKMTISAPLPEDFQRTVDALRELTPE